MSLEAIGRIATWKKLDARLRGAAYELANCHNAETGKCHPSHSYLAQRLDCNKRTVIRLLQQLEQAGVIVIDHTFQDGRQVSNTYTILADRGDNNVTGVGDSSVTGESDTGDTPEGDKDVIQKQEEETGRISNSVLTLEQPTIKQSKDQGFDDFWSAYPKKVNKKNARAAWRKLDTQHKKLATKDCKTRYKETERQFIPNPASYLNGERWEDERFDKPKQQQNWI